MIPPLLEKLRRIDGATRAGGSPSALAEWTQSGVVFAASHALLEARYYQAIGELFDCVKSDGAGGRILHEGAVYHGCWLESTGTINAEVLARFLPSVAAQTYTAFARHQRSDGLIPYKITAEGPAFAQIQLVTPLARSVWNHYRLNGQDRAFLACMYKAMSRYDDWLATYRDTRGTGAVEAFCAYDTGHDLSPRFWHMPDSPHGNDPRQYNRDNPLLPLIAPDLTANVVCQRRYLALIAEELGEPGEPWRAKAALSLKALFAQCHDADDGFFYDRDRNGRLIRVQSDVLLRVLACEVGDDDFFADALRRYLLNTGKFFAKYPFTSIALDDPRFDHAFGHNSWAGPSNFLSLIRAAHAFEHHSRHVEMSWVIYPILAALIDMPGFPQTLSPFTGAAGFSEKYAPAILCLLDFVERLSGILPTPDGEVWFTGLVPYAITHKEAAHETAYGRMIDGHRFELVNLRGGSTVYRDGETIMAFPLGVRVVTDRAGAPLRIIGMRAAPVAGVLEIGAQRIPFSLHPNEQAALHDGAFRSILNPGLVPPGFG